MIVLVVGASGGLGSRLSQQLDDAGATVIRTARNGTAEGVVLADLRDEGAPASLLAAAVEEHGRIDGIIIAAGVVAFGPVEELTDATIHELFAVNALTPIRLIRDAMPHLRASSEAGRDPFILTLTGVVSEAPTFGLAAYSASKAALAAFGQAATRDLRRAGIRIIDARPAHVETGLAGHPIAGTSPKYPEGLDPDVVAARLIRAIVDDEKDLPSTAF